MPIPTATVVNVQPHIVNAKPSNFNSYFHTASDAPDLNIPSESPYSFSRWLPLIASSQGIPLSTVQIVTLTPSQTRLLISAAGASLQTGKINQAYEEDLSEDILPSFQILRFPTAGLFMRLDACSAKDSLAAPSKTPILDANDIILRLTTSVRAVNAMRMCLEHGEKEVGVYFLPFNTKMSTTYEYRVFCAPRDRLRITAISQYKWYSPQSRTSQPDVDLLMRGIDGIHREILGALELTEQETGGNKEKGDNQGSGDEWYKPSGIQAHKQAKEMMFAQGCTFDVMWDREENQVALIELNTFGARSGCGSCLFHWIQDREVLYGGRGDKYLEFRISLTEDDGNSQGDN